MFNSTKISAMFLAIVLVAGTIIAISPSFIVGAQSQQDYGGMDNRYNTYEPEPGYSPEYADREYNSYELSQYEKETYETPSYGNNNYYEPREYPSYQPDNKPEYPSDNNYKSKKDSNSVSINKLNCINNNVNINGNNTGDINVGNSGRSASSPGTDEGYLGVGSSGDNYGEGYDNGYKKQKDQGFTCIINNSNINNNFEAGNTTDGNEILTCEECFLDALGPTLLAQFEQRYLAILQLDITEYCDASIQNEIESGISVSEIVDRIHADLNLAGIELDSATLAELAACLFELFG